MARFRQKAFFTLEEAREVVLDPDSENEFDNLELSSDEDYSDVELEDDEARSRKIETRRIEKTL